MTVEAPVWLDALTHSERASLSRRSSELTRPDVLVVGGGIVGVATARACQEAGVGSVLLIEADELGAGASRGAAGLLSPEAHQGVDPAPLVDLGRAGLDGWRELEASVPGGIGLLERDCIYLSPHPPGFSPHPSAASEWLAVEEVARLVPGLAEPAAGILIRQQARVNPLRALVRLADGIPDVATSAGAVGVEIGGGRITSVRTTSGTVAPGAVVFATGTPPQLEGLDLSIPADRIKGHIVVTAPLPVRLPLAVEPIGTPLEDGRLLMGGSLDIGDSTPEVNPRMVEGFLAYLGIVLPEARGVGVSHQWCCFRPHHPDHLPVIDRVPGIDNAWITSGHYRTGVLMAPATGAVLAEWLSSGRRPVLAEAFSATRFDAP